MSFFCSIPEGLRSLFRKKHVNRELNEELGGFLEMATEDKMKQGLSPEEAQRAVRLERGSVEISREAVRSSGWEHFLETSWQDLRFAFRMLRKNPGFTAVAVLTLALAIGASTAIFSVVDAVLLRPLPYPRPEQIVRIWEQAPDGHSMNVADGNFGDFVSQNNTLAALGGYGYGLSSISGGSEPVRVNVAAVTRGFFPSLGVAPFLGRSFAPEEQRPHGTPAIIVSYAYWQRYLGGASALSQFHLAMDGGVYSVVGVMPAGFDFPAGIAAWIPSEPNESYGRTAHNWRGIGRVRDGVTVDQARTNLSTIARRIRAQYGKEVDLVDAAVVPLSDAMVGDVRTALYTLLGAVGLLLLVSCTNVAGLLLARNSARRKELAVRAALGAGRGRLVQQFLAESLALSFAGGLLGILLAAWAVRILPAILPANLPRQEGIAINTPVLLFALAAMLLVAVSLGFFAAWRAGQGDLQEALGAGTRGNTGGVSTQRLRAFLVIGEIAASLMILVGAGLLARSFLRLISTSPGFGQQNLITMEFSPPVPPDFSQDAAAKARQIRLLDDLVSRISSIPGAESVGLAGALPVAAGDDLANGTFLLIAPGQKSPTTFDEWGRLAQIKSQTGSALYCVIGDGYFRSIGVPIIRGRMFTPQDDINSPHVAVISQALAQRRWPDQDPVGQTINFSNMDGILNPFTIVGIVGDVRAEGLDRPASSVIYVNYRQRGMNSNSSPTILVRSSAPTAQIVGAARGMFRDLAPDVPVKFSTFADEMGGWLADRRFLLLHVGFFAATALLLAAIGIYGVVAFSVARRTQEIGVRIALGAARSDILRMILGEGGRLAILGVIFGIVASLIVTRLMSSLLFGISATDPLTFVAVAALLSLVALFASAIPARRAIRVDPIVALREE